MRCVHPLELAQSAQNAGPMTMSGMPCDMMMMSAAGADHGKPMAPCKGMTPDCIKQMGCVTDVAVPALLVNDEFVAHGSARRALKLPNCGASSSAWCALSGSRC
jgi:hypothetical protein